MLNETQGEEEQEGEDMNSPKEIRHIFRGKPEAWCEFHSSKTNLEEVMVNGDREISEQEYHRVCVVLSIHDS